MAGTEASPRVGSVGASARRSGTSMGELAYEVLRDAIVEGRYPPGDQLVQEQLAEELGVSRTPLRDALNRLVHDGLVTAVLGRGYRVNDLTDQDIDDVFTVRERLEVLALEGAFGRLTRLDQARLETLVEEMQATDPTDAKRQYELNRRFHQSLVEPCGNRILLAMLDQLWDLPVSRRITKSYVHDSHNVALMVAEHRAILHAMTGDDLAEVVALATAHMTTGYGEARGD